MPRCLCPHCARPIDFPAELAGQEQPCPYCKKPARLVVDDAPLVRLPSNAPKAQFVKRVGTEPAPAPASVRTAPPQAVPRGAVTALEPTEPEVAIPEPDFGPPPELGPIQDLTERLLNNIERVVVGKRDRIQLLLTACLAEGHVLLEDVPGVAKTMLARALAQSLGIVFKRLQCTPDLLPGDVTGVSVFNPRTTEFEFRPGPVFAQVLLADEINRATPRTQSALLEVMAERSVTVDGTVRSIDRPFLLIATQNPIDHEGTFPLPEAQLDRFLVRLSLGYPSFDEETRMLARLQGEHPIDSLQAVASGAELAECQRAVRSIRVDAKIREYIVALVRATREHDAVALGASPRAAIGLTRAAQAFAAMQGLDFVLPDHIKEVLPAVLGHRVIVHPEKRLRKVTAAAILKEILHQTSVPTLPALRRA
jgi:MoxR-like ATPase